MKRILCPTDFSDAAHNAMMWAAKFCQVVQAELVLYNVQPEIISFDNTAIKKSIEEVTQYFERQSLHIAKTFKISCYAETETSPRLLSQTITEKARGFDMIIMGSNGPDDFTQFLAGSNTYNVIRKTNIPLLLIPDDLEHTPISKITLAYDYLKERKLPLKHLTSVVKDLDANLSILQVMEEARSAEMERDLQELQFILKAKHFTEIKFEFETVRSAEIGDSIDSYMLRSQQDMLVLCSMEYGLLDKLFRKSVIKNISSTAKYPVLIVHE